MTSATDSIVSADALGVTIAIVLHPLMRRLECQADISDKYFCRCLNKLGLRA
mgnify:CR=1 FL=1